MGSIRDPDEYQELLNRSPDVLFVLDGNLQLEFINSSVETLLGIDQDAIIGQHASEFLDHDAVSHRDFNLAIEACERVMEDPDVESDMFEISLRDTSGNQIDAEYHITSLPAGDSKRRSRILGVIRDVTKRNERESEIRIQRDELQIISTINEETCKTIEELIEAEDTEELYRQVCSRFIELQYIFSVYIFEGGPESGHPSVVTTSSDGKGVESLAYSESPLSGSDLIDEMRHIEEPTVIDDPATYFPEWTEVGRSMVPEFGILVPIQIYENTMAILGIISSNKTILSDQVMNSLQILGDVIGYATEAIRNRRLRFADTVTELTIRIHDSEAPLVAISEALEGTVTADGNVMLSNDLLGIFVTISRPIDGCIGRSELESVVNQCDWITDYSIISTDDEQWRIVLKTNLALGDELEAGSRVASAVAADGQQTMTLELAPGVDPSSVLDRVQSRFNDTQLVSIQTVPHRSNWTGQPFGDAVQELTPKQRDSLKAAYLAGYFDWPARQSNAEEVAEILGITSATFHGHLRKAQSKLIGASLAEF